MYTSVYLALLTYIFMRIVTCVGVLTSMLNSGSKTIDIQQCFSLPLKMNIQFKIEYGILMNLLS